MSVPLGIGSLRHLRRDDFRTGCRAWSSPIAQRAARREAGLVCGVIWVTMHDWIW